jgi:F-type H+-transporting ATPase subunit b
MEALGINGALLLSQVLNFGVMAAILYVLLYKRILGMLQERTQRIEQSLKDASDLKQQLADTKRHYDEEIRKARQEASEIRAQAHERVKKDEIKIIAEAEQEAAQLKADAQEQIKQERARLLKGVQGQVGDLVMLTASKVLRAELAAKGHDKLIEESLALLD